MAFDLEHRSLDGAKGLATFYNEQVADLPYCHVVDAEAFDWGIRRPRYHESFRDALGEEEVIVAKQDGNIVGFIHLADEIKPHDDSQSPGGIIRFLSYVPGYREVGQMLLASIKNRVDVVIARI